MRGWHWAALVGALGALAACQAPAPAASSAPTAPDAAVIADLLSATPTLDDAAGTAIAIMQTAIAETPTPFGMPLRSAASAGGAPAPASPPEQPAEAPSPAPTDTPTPAPTDTPTLTPTPGLSFEDQMATAVVATLTAQPTETPTPTLTPDATATARAVQNAIETSVAETLTAQPTPTPTDTPTRTPTFTPTQTPTVTPTRTPTETPTRRPTRAPTDTPTRAPTPTFTPLPRPRAQRLDYPIGATTVTVSGGFPGNGSVVYVGDAQAGQTMEVQVDTDRPALLTVYGDDGVWLAGPTTAAFWSGVLPSTQDYYVALEPQAGEPISYVLSVYFSPLSELGTGGSDAPQPSGPPARISFEPGSISAVVSGSAAAGSAQAYVLRAMEDQTMTVELYATDGAGFTVAGDDGSLLKSAGSGGGSWSGVLPSSQDYIITVYSTGGAIRFDLIVTVVW